MNRMTAPLAALLMLPALAGVAHAQASDVIGGHVHQWWPEFSGTIKGSSPGFDGANADLRDDLGLFRESSGVTELAIWGRFPVLPFKIHFSAYGGAVNDGNVLSRPITFEGNVFAPGTPVKNEIVLRAYTFMLDFGMGTPTMYQTSVQWGVQVGFQYMAHEFQMQAGAIRADEKLETVIPMLGVRLSIKMGGLLELYGLIQGIGSFGITKDYEGHLLDMRIELRWWASGGFAFGVGYRAIHMFGENSDNDNLSMLIHGIFVSAILQY